MEIRVLGSSGSGGYGQNSPAFLLDDFLLLDAGTISSLEQQYKCQITHILLTHSHLDHIKGIPFLVDDIVTSVQGCEVTILSGKDVIAYLKRHLFNNKIWPDFTTIPDREHPSIRYEPISAKGAFRIRGYTIHATRVNHVVPAYGYMIEDASNNALVYTGDTGPTEKIWKRMRGHRVKVLIIEVSFPNELKDLALLSGHLTPSLLEEEVRKMPHLPEKIYITHPKYHYRETIKEELAGIREFSPEILEDDMMIHI